MFRTPMGKIPIRRALIGGGLEREVEKIRRLATCIGLLFQVVEIENLLWI